MSLLGVLGEELHAKIESSWPNEYIGDNKDEFKELSKKREELIKKMGK